MTKKELIEAMQDEGEADWTLENQKKHQEEYFPLRINSQVSTESVLNFDTKDE